VGTKAAAGDLNHDNLWYIAIVGDENTKV